MQQKLREVDIARKEFIATACTSCGTPIFCGRLRRAAPGRGPRRGDARVRGHDARAGGAPAEAVRRPARPVPARPTSVELHTEPVDLAELTRSVVGEFRPALQDHRTELRMEIPDEGPLAECDRERVAQIMRILLDNALRHTLAGTDVTVSAQRENGSAEFTADEGPGLPPGWRDKAFERPARRRAARASGSRSPASWRSACTAGSSSRTATAPPSSSSCPRTDPSRKEERRSWAGARARRSRLRCLRGRRGLLSGDDARGHDDARRGRRGHRPRGRLRPRPDLLAALARGRHGHLAVRRGPTSVLEDGGEGGQGSGFLLDDEATSPRMRTSTKETTTSEQASACSCSSRTAIACPRRSWART